ncbi:MAG: putative porin [Phycisphaerae bacterium]|nr:putative porin [Phycisphaerae bacterium]
MKNRLVLPVVLVMFGAMVFTATTATAADKPEQDVTSLIKALTERLEAQDKKISLLENKLTDEALQAARHDEIAKIMSDMRADASNRDPLPGWLDNLKFFADLRLRFEHHSQDGSSSAGIGIQRKPRNRYRFRLRFGFIKTWLDEQMEVGFRLASGSLDSGATTSAGRSTNQTLTGTFNKKDLWIDRAYAKYSPNAIPGLTFIAGKMANPLEHTDLIWDSDLNPEGIVVQYHRALCGIDVFGNFAHLSVRETQSGHDTILNVYQGGFRAPLPCGMKTVVAIAWYDFDDYESLGLVPGDNFNGWNRNTQLINVLAKVKFTACGLPWQVYFDWVHNNQDNQETADFENADDGFALGVKVGKNKKQGDWSAGYKYKYIEFNATPGNLNDADFGTPSGRGTNIKGHVFKAAYNLTDFLVAGSTIMLVQPITHNGRENDFLFQFDLIWKF